MKCCRCGCTRGMDGQGGFTLVELLMATVISSLLMVATVGVLTVGFRSFATVASRDVQGLERLQLLRLFQEDIASAMVVNGVKFEGDARSLRCLRLASSQKSPRDLCLVRVVWTQDASGNWVRTEWTWPQESERAVNRWGGMGVMRFRYRGAVAEATEGLTAWQDSWVEPRLPGCVRLNWGAGHVDCAVMQANAVASKGRWP